MRIRVVLISQYPLPYKEISSWPKMYDYYLSNCDHLIDYIICPKIGADNILHPNIQYRFASRLPLERWTKRITGYKFYNFLNAARRILQTEPHLIVKIIDNIGLLQELHDYFLKRNLRNKITIVFFIHGFSYFFNPHEGVQFYEKIDHIVYLTKKSYLFELDRYSYITSRVHILPNGVDSTLFYRLLRSDDASSKSEKISFLWVSQDRPKKGLHILLEAWKKSSLYNDDKYELSIIGTEKSNISDGNIKWLGKIPNSLLADYYRSCDYYLFTTLVHEGTPLSLIEAIKCGCTVLCSKILPLEEVTRGGKYAYLVDAPHIAESWIEKLESIKAAKLSRIEIDANELAQYYDLNDWCKNMNHLLEKIISCVSTSSSPTA